MEQFTCSGPGKSIHVECQKRVQPLGVTGAGRHAPSPRHPAAAERFSLFASPEAVGDPPYVRLRLRAGDAASIAREIDGRVSITLVTTPETEGAG